MMAATMVTLNGVLPLLYLLVSAITAKAALPYSLGVRDSLMIAHSFHGNSNFGPAGGLVRLMLECHALPPSNVDTHTATIMTHSARSYIYM